MPQFLRRSVQISFLNLAIVAVFGVVLRYKIAFSLPFIDQKFFLHAHSHFAFGGWLTQVLMTFLVLRLCDGPGENSARKYRWVLWGNLACAYGMLISFSIQGYGAISIIFSTLSIFVSYFFGVMYWTDSSKAGTFRLVHHCFRIALIALVISSAGPFTLAYMMATKHIHQNLYLASVYFYLHFQYNGWFFFSCLGLSFSYFLKNKSLPASANTIFILFAGALLPAFLLSILWAHIPAWCYALAVAAVMAQVVAWFLFIRDLKKNLTQLKKTVTVLVQRLLLLSGLALSVKLLLQAGSVIPSLSKLAFGFRPIVIAYLHLVLLGVISLFIIGYSLAQGYFSITRFTRTGIIIFASGIVLNETVLMIQGISALDYIAIGGVDLLLFVIAIILFLGAVIMASGNWKKTSTQTS